MKSLATATHLHRVGAAALLAAAAILGTTTSTVADPATACAKPKDPGFDRAGYEMCRGVVDDQFQRGIITPEDWEKKRVFCCTNYGGKWVIDNEELGMGHCEDPAEGTTQTPQLPQVPGPSEATQPPAPPPPPAGPIAPLPSMPPVQTR